MEDSTTVTNGSNDDYLRSAIEWVRLRLQRLATNGELAEIDDAELREAESAMTSGAETTVGLPALVALAQMLGLSAFERNLLLLCAAMELDTRIAALCEESQGVPPRPYPTFALAMTLFDDPHWDALSSVRPLRYWHLVQIHQADSQRLVTCPLRIDERIVNFIKGFNYIDDRLTSLLSELEASSSETQLPESQQATVDEILARIKKPGSPLRTPLIQLLGPDSTSKRLIALQVANALGVYCYHLQVALLPTTAVELEMLARLWYRESVLLPVALFLDSDSIEGENQDFRLRRFLTQSNGLFFFDTREELSNMGRAHIAIDVAKPTPAEQRAVWEETLGELAPEAPALLAGQFSLGSGDIREIAGEASGGTAKIVTQQLWQACLDKTRPKLDTLAERIIPKACWDDMVIHEDNLRLLHQIANQVKHRDKVYEQWGFRKRTSRGFGLVVLFAGESGTGKTMAAEIISNELNLNLHRIDLSAVVSKYIGETEKNLRRLFDAAEAGGAILFFDEADALFGKRSQVRDSHDRYANIEINYLLQRLEAFQGLAILATNMKSSLDEAFTRRFRFIVDFPVPVAEDRKRIWQKIFPEETPLGDVDFERLATYKLTGGDIYNCALNAAFTAAEASTAVSMPHILDAIRTEFQKSNRLINETSFSWDEGLD